VKNIKLLITLNNNKQLDSDLSEVIENINNLEDITDDCEH